MEEEYHCNEDIHEYMRENNEYEERICLFCNLKLEEYYCNEDIHKYMRENNEYEEGICLFCNLQLEEYKPKTIQKCCENPNFIFDKGRVCINCGIIDFNYSYMIPYMNFPEDKYKIRIKTIYNPKYCDS